MIKKILIVIGCIIPNLVFAQSINSVNTQGYFNFHGGSLPINAKTIINVDGIDYVIGDLIKTINEGFGNISNLETQINQAANDANTALGLANQAQTTANNAVPTSKIGQAGWVAGLDTNKNITNAVIGNVANGIADSSGDLVSDIATIAKEAQSSSTNAIPLTQKGAAEGVATTDANNMMNMSVSGDSSNSPVIANGTTQSRLLSLREADTNNLSNYVKTYDGSTNFQNSVTSLYNSLNQNAIITLPCGAKWPFYNTTTGIAWGPSGKGVLFVDTCGNNWYGAPGWATPAYDRGFGDNNNVFANYNGDILINRQNLSSSNGNGQLSLHVTDYSTSASNYGGTIFADSPQLRVTYDMMQYGTDGVTGTRGSPVAGRFIVNNWTGQTWAVQAQGLKQTCNVMVAGGSCWSGSFETNDKSGHTGKSFNLIHENDQESNGPESALSTWDPKQSNRFMEYYSAIAMSPPSWSANTTYNKLSGGEPNCIDIFDSTSTERIMCVKTAGVSGTTVPVVDMSTMKEYDTITDGTVVWEIGTVRSNTVGVVIMINHDPAVSGGNASDMNSYNFGISTNARFNNSVLDTSHAIMNNSRSAAIRIGNNQNISLCDPSTAASDSDINNCILTHSSNGQRLNYNIGGRTVSYFGDNGNIWSSGTIIAGAISSTYDANINGNVHVGASLYLGSHPRSYIFAISSPIEGQKVFDSDDHVEVTYRCPTSNTCGWYDPDNNNISIITSISNEGLTSSGSSITDSLKLTAITNTIITSNSGTGVQLPNSFIGTNVVILNRSANPINVYPESSTIQIENLGNGKAQDLEPNSSITFIKTSSTEWRIK